MRMLENYYCQQKCNVNFLNGSLFMENERVPLVKQKVILLLWTEHIATH